MHAQTARVDDMLVVQVMVVVLNVQQDITIMERLTQGVLLVVHLKKEPLSVAVNNALVIVTEVSEVIHAQDI